MTRDPGSAAADRKKPWKRRAIARVGKILNVLLAAPFRVLGRDRQAIVVSTILEHLSFVYTKRLPGDARLRFFGPAYKPAWRGISVLTKQPEVPQWIDGFEPKSVYWDVGANVGAYVLYAALRPETSVVAFEPEASNFYVLSRNVALNDMSDRVTVYPLALAEKMRFDRLSSVHLTVGGSRHAFGDPSQSWWTGLKPIFRQGMVAFSIDELVFEHGFDFPNYLKIDVDGIEDLIIAGAKHAIGDQRLRSILVERQPHRADAMRGMHDSLIANGFEVTTDAGANVIYTRAAMPS